MRWFNSVSLGVLLLAIMACTRERTEPAGDSPSTAPAADPIVHKGKSLQKWIAALEDRDPDVRAEAAAALGELGPRAAPAIPALILMWKKDDGVGLFASGALAKIGPAAIPALRDALLTDDEDFRARALTELGRMGAPAVPILIEALPGASFSAWKATVDALVQIGEPAVPALTQAMKGGEPRLRSLAASALAEFGEKAPGPSPR